jgi:microsomal dipeptidase-like Zn-dependent dipeptidase
MNGLLRPMLKSYLDFPSLIAPLFKYFKDDEVRKILGGNYLRVFGQVTAENKN